MIAPRQALGLGLAALVAHVIGGWWLRETWIAGFETRSLSEPDAIGTTLTILVSTGVIGGSLSLAATYTAFRTTWRGWGRYVLVVGVCAPACMVAITFLWAAAMFTARV